MGEVVELVKHLRDDGKLAPLMRQLEEIAFRVQASAGRNHLRLFH